VTALLTGLVEKKLSCIFCSDFQFRKASDQAFKNASRIAPQTWHLQRIQI